MKSKIKFIQLLSFSFCKIFAVALGLGIFILSCSDEKIKQDKTIEENLEELKMLTESPGYKVLSKQKVVRFGENQKSDSIKVRGIIIPDERRTNRIAARFGGRIEKLYVRYPFQYIKKGEKLLDLYSPDLNTTIAEFIFLFEKDKTSSLTELARKKLLLLGLSENQLRDIEINGKVPSTISVFSPYDGYIITTTEVNPGKMIEKNLNGNMSGMKEAGSNDKKESEIDFAAIREGSYIVTGQTLFSVNDAEEVIALVTIDPLTQVFIEKGFVVNVTSEMSPGKSVIGIVDLIEPVFQDKQHFLAVRTVLKNDDGLFKFNSLVIGEISIPSRHVNMLPSSSVFDLGKRKIVWVKVGNSGESTVFIPRIILVGYDDGRYVEILSGLQPKEEVATDAGLLVDREVLIQTEQP